jgi:VCBS repeat protein
MRAKRTLLGAALILALGWPFYAIGGETDSPKPWVRHTIDASSQGADGVRLADVNGDGREDIVTGWEEGGVVRVCMQPDAQHVRRPWPGVTVGRVGDPEDAVAADLDEDGRLDVVSCHEGKTQGIWVHWAPQDPRQCMDSSAWKSAVLPASQGTTKWMYCVPMQVDGKRGIDLLVGAKDAGAEIGWFESPENPRALDQWIWHSIRSAGWMMSLITADLDGDGDLDVLASDRKGPRRGCFWLEHPGFKAVLDSAELPTRSHAPQEQNKSAGLTPASEARRVCPSASNSASLWPEHAIGASDHEVMFLTLADLGQDGEKHVLTATKDNGFVLMPLDPSTGTTVEIPLPDGTGSGKGVAMGDIDLNGRPDIVFSCEHAGGKTGVMWLEHRDGAPDTEWVAHDISGLVGTKYDLVVLRDLDGDGDLDVLTCEERENLGVIWYENPAKN